MRNPINFKVIIATILLAVPLWLSAIIWTQSVYAAPGIGGNECVQDGNNCKEPTQNGGNGGAADPSSQGSAGADPGSTAAACQGLDQLGGASCNDPGSGKSAVGDVANRVVKIISYIAGIIAIIMIIIAGVRYTTSGGDSAKVGAAKTALIYALIGLAVAATAQVLVRIVLSNV